MEHPRANLWAPWRMEYIEGLGGGERGTCFLCRVAGQEAEHDARDYVLWRGPRTICLLNRWPYNSGHVLIAPLVHRAQLAELDDDVLLELMQRTRDVQRILEIAVRAQGFNIGINIGHCSGAGVPEHLHQHVVPRWAGDTNYMAVVADVKVIPQSLQAVRELFLKTGAELGVL